MREVFHEENRNRRNPKGYYQWYISCDIGTHWLSWERIFPPGKDAKAGTGTNTGTAQATVTEELTAKRSKFVKQFALSDGSFTATIYSMPIHYKKNGRWKEINTTLVKSGKTKYKTKATDLSIKVSKKQIKNPLYL